MGNIEDKVLEFLVAHKTQVLPVTLSKRFLISQSHVGRILKDLVDRQLVEVVPVGKNKFYKVKQ